MHINYILNLGISKKSYTGSGSFEIIGSASTKTAIPYIGSGVMDLFGSAIVAGPKYFYTASGSFELSGSGSIKIPVKTFKNIKFNINQTGTTADNQQYNVTQIQGTSNQPIYFASNTLQQQYFNNNNLFTDPEIAELLSLKYLKEILQYQENINVINERLSTAPLPVDDSELMSLKFLIKENFINLENQENQIISIFGTSSYPNYQSNSETANNVTALTPPDNVAYRSSKYKKQIDEYNAKINIIDSKLAGMVPPTDIPSYTNVKFTIKQDGYNDLNQPVMVKSIIGTSSKKYFDSIEGLYAESQLLDDSEAANYFSKKYEDKISTYMKKLEEINGRLNA